MREISAIVSGKVQGVSYRDFVRSRANSLSLCGYVRNRPDGTVEVMAQGGEAELHALLMSLREGSPQSRVSEIKEEWREASHAYPVFQIEY